MTTGAVTGIGEQPPDRRQLLRLIGAGAAATALAGCSIIKMIGGPGTVTGSRSPAPRPTVLATAVPLLGAADAGTVETAVGLVVTAAGRLYGLALQRPDLHKQLTAVATAHEAHLGALAAVAATPVPAHSSLDPTRSPVATGTPPGTPNATASTAPPAAPTKPVSTTTPAFLAAAASIEGTLAGGLTTQTARAVDPDVATLLASVAASATSWQTWFQVASVVARPNSGG